MDICCPGDHGGVGDKANKWLVTVNRRGGPYDIREYFGATLTEALEMARSDRKGDSHDG